jgi:imidazolonepropionase-like amidohydrolase
MATLALAGARAETLAVIHARLEPVSGPAVADGTVVVRGGTIAAVGAGLVPPADARVIDAHGALVTPGLMNGATALGLVEVSSVSDTADQAVTAGPLGAAFDVQYALNPNSELLPHARADGLTRAASLPAGSASAPFAGQAAVLRLSEGPDILDRPRAAMVAIVGGAAAAQAGGSRAAQWQLLRNALEEARRYRVFAAGRQGGPRDQLLNHLDAEALQPVIAGAMPLAIAASRESDIRQAVALGDDFGIRVIILGGQEAWRAAPLLAAHKVPAVLDPFDDLPATFDQMGARLDNAARLAAAGVVIAFSVPGLDYSHNAGSALREAAGLAVANGLDREIALKAMTINPARIWGIGDHYGALAPGMDADLVVWDGDPLEPTSAPTLVLVRGRVVSLVTRQTRLRDRYAPAHRSDPWPPAYH